MLPLPLLEVQLMGHFAVRVNGEEIERHRWERQSAKALIKLLALAPAHTLHREQVIELVWPDQDITSGSNSLNKAIHAARRALEPELAKGGQSQFILTERNQIRLASPGALHVDLRGFEQAANRAVRERQASVARDALRLYGGTLLVDDLYEPWARDRRESAEQLFRNTSMGAAQWFADEGEPAQGIEIVQRLLTEDATDEPAHRLLMRLYAASGDRGQALRQFELGRRALQAAGFEPGPEMVQLEASVRLGLLDPTAPAAPAAARGRAGSKANATAQPAVAALPDSWSPQITPLTFRPGEIRTVRFLPCGKRVLLTASWDGAHDDVYELTLATGHVERLPWRDAELFAVSAQGDLALGTQRHLRNILVHLCTLSIVPAGGGAPIELAHDVQWADWHPHAGPRCAEDPAGWLAIVRDVDGKCRLEYPIGTRRFESQGWISHVRFSPDGLHLAFIDHKIDHDDEGDLSVIDLDAQEQPGGSARVLARGFLLIQGLAWLGQDLWFTASRKGMARSLYRLAPDGSEQLMHSRMGNLELHDARAAEGLLVTADKQLIGTMSRVAGEPAERDISWHDYTTPRDISADGQMLLVEEGYTTGRQHYVAYLRKTDGSATQAIGEGVPLVLSPDQRKVILRLPSSPSSLAVLDLATRQQQLLPNDATQPLIHNEFASFFPDSQRIVFAATDQRGGARIYLQDLTGGKPRCFTPDESGVRMPWNRAVAPDGQTLILMSPHGGLCRYPVHGGTATPIAAPSSQLHLVAWHADGQDVFVYRWEGPPTTVYRLHLATGAMTEWLTLSPRDVGTVSAIRRLRMTPDGQSYAYGFSKQTSDLYRFSDG